MKKICPFLFLMVLMRPEVQAQVNARDLAWKEAHAAIANGYEAAFIIRTGDVDNLNFGWPEGFDPFCGRMTDAHAYPFEPLTNDVAGQDRILLSSRFRPEAEQSCGGDGYSGTFDPAVSKPVATELNLSLLSGATIQDAWLQIFIDDFQAPVFCSHFTITLNGKRFVEGEKVLNAIEQTGPVGKLISLKIPEEFYNDLLNGQVLKVLIDETTGAADGFAIDFMRLLVNRKRENSCYGTIRGFVRDKNSGEPVPGAEVSGGEGGTVMTDSEGAFTLRKVPTGFAVLSATAPGYTQGSGTGDVSEGEENEEIIILLEKGEAAVQFDGQSLRAGESIKLTFILFDQGKADLRPASLIELDKVASFLKANPTAEIELSGHTSSEGDAAYNRSLSYRRVKSCKDYIVSKGIETGRILVVGYGPDKPVASNDNEEGRALNRRVEMRLLKL